MRVVSLITAIALALVAVPVCAHADDRETASLDGARFAFAEGTAHYEARRYLDALASFERSYRTVQSPNALLMIARCQRELGRKAEAVATFERAAADARQKVASGENKYAPTADAADDEGRRLRATLGTLHVRVEGGAGGTVLADGKPLPLSSSGDVVVLREAGTVAVEFSRRSGARQRQTATLVPGATIDMTFTEDAAAAAAGPAPTPGVSGPSAREREAAAGSSSEHTTTSRWRTPAWIAGGVAAAGAVTFTAFGLSAQSTYDELARRCGPDRCGPNDRADADRGARQQTIANVGLGVALTAAFTTLVFVVLTMQDEQKPAPSTTTR